MKKIYNVLDLFCGAGGFSYGLSRNDNFLIKVASDFNEHALKTYENNHKNVNTICGDIKNPIIQDKIIQSSKSNKVNMVIGGPPCTGFSLKGKNLGIYDSRNFLFLEYLNIVSKLLPEIFVIENVPNLLKSENGYFIKQIKEKFAKLGYKINYEILNVKDYGVPQSRKRAIIIGSFDRIIDFDTKKYMKELVTVKDAISDLSYLDSGTGDLIDSYKFEAQSDYQKLMRNNSEKVQYHVATKHTDETLFKLSLIPECGDKSSLPKEYWGKQKFNTTWSRLKWDDISPTIDTRFDTPSNGRNSHPKLHRAITPREAARIQSFPDDFHFVGKKSHVCMQIGNAVPPLLGEVIGKLINDNNESDSNILINGDSYEKINFFINNDIYVDHIITDPPYNISQENNFSTMKNSKRKGVDFGKWDYDFDLFNWINKYSKILKPGGSWVIFCSYKYISDICKVLEENDAVVKDVIVWQKNNPMPRNIHRRYVQDLEFAIWAVKPGEKWKFNKISESYQRSYFYYPITSTKERLGHPTQKPLKLMEDIIKIHTDEGDLILDPFMGVGTTCHASQNLNRKYIGVEREKDYYKVAVKRLKQS